MHRSTFLQQSALLAAGALMNPLQSWASEKPDGKIRVAVIGCGSVSGMYLPHLTKSPFVEVVSVCDIIPDRAASRAAEFKVAHRYTDINQLLAGEPFDLLINLTDMQEHGRLNKIALNSGKHVWSEKPLANSYTE
jgi:predicted dehydrogenase